MITEAQRSIIAPPLSTSRTTFAGRESELAQVKAQAAVDLLPAFADGVW
jgi:hypothetical protein